MKLGDRIQVLDDDISGIVKKIEGKTIYIETSDGFEFSFEASQLILDNSKDFSSSIFRNKSSQDIVKEKEEPSNPKSKRSKPKERTRPSLVIDLHIEKLVDSTRGLSNFDMLNLQLETIKQQLYFAMQKRIQKVVFIHGVGEGVLKMELETLLRRYDNLKYYDADYRTYGYGATEVYIFQNNN